MAHKVVHVSDTVHAAAKQYCNEQGIRMSDWVSKLIKDTLNGSSGSAIKKKSLLNLGPQRTNEEVVAAPPFWEKDKQ